MIATQSESSYLIGGKKLVLRELWMIIINVLLIASCREVHMVTYHSTHPHDITISYIEKWMTPSSSSDSFAYYEYKFAAAI